MKFKKLIGTRAHEARVLPGFQRHLTHKLSNKKSHSQSFKLSQTPTLKVSEKKEKEKGTLTNTHSRTNFQTLTHGQTFKHSLSLTSAARGLSSAAALRLIGDSRLLGSSAARGLRSTVPSFSLSLSIGLPLIVSAENPNEPQIIIRNPKFAC